MARSKDLTSLHQDDVCLWGKAKLTGQARRCITLSNARLCPTTSTCQQVPPIGAGLHLLWYNNMFLLFCWDILCLVKGILNSVWWGIIRGGLGDDICIDFIPVITTDCRLLECDDLNSKMWCSIHRFEWICKKIVCFVLYTKSVCSLQLLKEN